MQRLALVAILAVLFLSASARQSHAFVYIFTGEGFEDRVTHPIGYVGTGGTLNITVGIDNTSVNASAMETSVQNVVNTWNNLTVTTGNIQFGNIPGGSPDFESVLLHEVGHSLGLGHVNAASESGLSGSSQNYTKATDGADNVFNLNAGTDGVIGSADDIRGDDVNLNYFKIADNDPFTIAGTVDSTTYSRDVSLLPGADTFSANADRAVSTLLGYSVTEAAMQQGSFFGETQRTLAADDVAGLRYAMSGVDELAGTADDYTVNLQYVGQTSSADILIDFDNSVPFAASISSGLFIGATDHIRISSTEIRFNTGFNWHFTQAVPEPTSLALLGSVVLGLTMVRRRRS